MLDPDQVVAFCRVRGLGKAAAAADPTNRHPNSKGQTRLAGRRSFTGEGRRSLACMAPRRTRQSLHREAIDLVYEPIRPPALQCTQIFPYDRT